MIGRVVRNVLDALRSEEPQLESTLGPSRRQRLLVAVAIGLVSGAFCTLMALRPDFLPDLETPLTAARHYLRGENPYVVMSGGEDRPPPYDVPLYFPFTSIMGVAPLTLLPPVAAAGLFLGIGSGLLAFFVTRRGFWRLHMFMSAPFVVAATLSQFSPLLTCLTFIPAVGFLATLKPNIGLPLLARRLSVRAIVSCIAFVALSLVLWPTWLSWWLPKFFAETGGAPLHPTPVRYFGGFILLLALLAWRAPAGRLLLAMSLMPQLLFFYDQLPLWLVPQTRKQSIFLTACSQLAMILWYVFRKPNISAVMSAYPYVMALIYLPALIIVLRNRFMAPQLASSIPDPISGIREEMTVTPQLSS